VRRDDGVTVWRDLGEVPASARPVVCTIGVFDGVHRGHRALVREVVSRAAELDATPVVVTFDRHPLEVIAPDKAPPLITTVPQRARLFADLGIAGVLVLRFDGETRQMSPEEFVRRVLVDALGARHVVVGANFKFGHQQAGTIETLRDLGLAHGFGTTIYALQMGGDDHIVSSTMIRAHVAAGEVEQAAEELDRPFRLEGFVEHGASRGKGLGFPTANLRVAARMLLPKLGVYAGRLRWKDAWYPAVTNVGVNPTFGDRDTPIVETFVIDFDDDLYGEIVEVEFSHRLRDEMKFDGVEPLIEQMRADVRRARELLGI
jgi:riboflavin kinase/FMN adenylyltransferase